MNVAAANSHSRRERNEAVEAPEETLPEKKPESGTTPAITPEMIPVSA